MHLALLYKTLRNLQSSLVMWENLNAVHKKTYGERTHYLAADHKNIGTCKLGLNKPEEAMESFQRAELLIKEGLATQDMTEEEKKDEKTQLATVYFSMYLCLTAQEKYPEALIFNEKNRALNVEVYGENDLNVSNNHYLSAQIMMKQLKTKEALDEIEESN